MNMTSKMGYLKEYTGHKKYHYRVYCLLTGKSYYKEESKKKDMGPGFLDDVVLGLCGILDWLVE